MIPRDGDMNNIGSWNEDGDISWADLNDDGYAIIPEGDSITQTMELTNTIEYWQFSSYAQSGYQDSDELQVEIWNGAESFSYEGTLPISGFIDIPLTTTAVVTLTGVSSPTHLSYFCLHYAEECQFPDPELINLNYQWEPPERFGDLIGTYESYGGAQLDAGERFYQSIANDYPTQGDYSFHISGTATAPITLGVKLESCGLSGAGLGDDGYYQIPISPTGGVFDYYENVRCDGYNRLQVKNLGTSAVFVDRVCLEDALTCQPLGECNLSNENFEEANDAGDWAADWGRYEDRAAWTGHTTDTIILEPTGWISQAVCLEPGEYTLEVWATGITETESMFGIMTEPGRGDYPVELEARLDSGVQREGVILNGPGFYTLYTFDFRVTSATDWHELVIKHVGSRDYIAVTRVCLRRVGSIDYGQPEGCGLIENAFFALTSEDEASPWVTYGGMFDWFASQPHFEDGKAVLPAGQGVMRRGIRQSFLSTPAVTTYTLHLRARAVGSTEGALEVALVNGLHGADDPDDYGADSHLFTWEDDMDVVLTYTFELSPSAALDQIALEAVKNTYRSANSIELYRVCLFAGDIPTDFEEITVPNDCLLRCDYPRPTGCNTNLVGGDCEYYGKPAFDFPGWDEVFKALASYIGRSFQWIWCKLACYLRAILEAILNAWNDAFEGIVNADIPVLSDLVCWALKLPRLIVNAFRSEIEFYFAWLFVGAGFLRNAYNWLVGAFAAYVSEVEDLFFNAGDLLVAIIDFLILLVVLPAQFVGLVVKIMIAVITAFTSTSEESMTLPEAENLFWCAADIIERVISNTPLQWIPGLYLAKLTIDNLWWAIKKFASLGGEDY